MENKSIVVQKVKDLLDEASFVDACRVDVKHAMDMVVTRSHEESEPISDLFVAVSKYLDDLDSNAVCFIVEKLPELDSIEDGETLYNILVEATGENLGEYIADAGWDCDAADAAEPFTLADAARQLAEWREENEYLRRAYEYDKGVYA